MKKYDYLIVGAGPFGATFAERMRAAGRKCLVVDKRQHIGGNLYTKKVEGIQVHMYGPHIFHTSDYGVWEYMSKFATFNHFRYEPIANYKGKIYNLPFNMNTFYQIWGVSDPNEVARILEKQRAEIKKNPENLEEQAISLVGRDIYEILIKGYTEKQWGRSCKQLPPFIINRLPVRMIFDNNYFNDMYQGVPEGGYTDMFQRILHGIEVRLGVDYLEDKNELNEIADTIIYTGPIDEYYSYVFGELDYRGLQFKTVVLDCENYQGCAGMNYTDIDTPYTRIIEHKHFEFGIGNKYKTVITKEYPKKWVKGNEPFYPVNDERNQMTYDRYKKLALNENKVRFYGRLGTYRYINIDQVIRQALDAAEREII